MMRASIATALKQRWERLRSYSEAKKLSWFALILLFALDYYVLTLVFDGMLNAGKVIESPASLVSRDCQSMSVVFLNAAPQDRNAAMEVYVAALTDGDKDKVGQYFDDNARQLLPVCVKVRERLLASATDPTLRRLYTELKENSEGREAVKQRIVRLKDSYRDALLEKIADQKRGDSILPAEANKIKGEIDLLEAAMGESLKRQKELNVQVAHSPAMTEYLVYLRTLPFDAEFAREDSRFERQMFWYPIKVLGAEGTFLLPLLIVALYWNSREIKKQRHTHILISSHLILVFALPVFLKLLDFVYRLLPQALWELLISQLEAWRLSFLWNYFVIAAGISGGLLLIAGAQRTVFTPARLRASRLRKNLCRKCSAKLHSNGQAWCEFCGCGQSGLCGHCGSVQKLLAFHCSNCGTVLPQRE